MNPYDPDPLRPPDDEPIEMPRSGGVIVWMLAADVLAVLAIVALILSRR